MTFFGGVTSISIFDKNPFDDELECSRYTCLCVCPSALYMYRNTLAIKSLQNTRLFQKRAAKRAFENFC